MLAKNDSSLRPNSEKKIYLMLENVQFERFYRTNQDFVDCRSGKVCEEPLQNYTLR